MPAIVGEEIYAADQRDPPYVFWMRHGPGQAKWRTEIRHDEVERRHYGSALHQGGDEACHVVERQGEVIWRRRAAQSWQVRRIAVVLFLHTLYDRLPQISRIGYAVQEEGRGTRSSLGEVEIAPGDCKI